ncbi:phage tail protein [Helicobacter anatolicus]|uniref:phage tail protein n=1 Tax=Helicobacter anatolicus TaxID=2905874 RepID=UPI001E5956DE|nr:phage tail protein [Helicobacter anatolicus]MCE3037520.1 phage tail protein [Helicobacter anatolicus]MCE3040466.1 phage tail protein [Helicobacter anatolicus]
MKTYIAKQGERLDGIYFNLYGELDLTPTYDSGFHYFCLINHHLLHKAVLDGGDIVYIKEEKKLEKTIKELGI